MDSRFELEYVGPDNLPTDWRRATAGLVEANELNIHEGLALPAARHLYREATAVKGVPTGTLRRNIERLEELVDPASSSKIKSAGMAYPQLFAANKGSFRVFVAASMRTLRTSDRRKGTVFINPVVTPVMDEGTNDDIEMCCSHLAQATWVTRYNVIEIASDNHPVTRLEDTPARIAQHENDHLNGVICIDRGLSQQRGRVIYYVPTELRGVFWDEYYPQGRLSEWPLLFPLSQWRATKNGEYVIPRANSL